jgi:3-phenylpropionate/trans-cinnamate dioxygenase ferredoxin component
MSEATSMTPFVKVATVGDVPPGTMRAVEFNGRRVLLVNADGEVHALDARCAHRGGPLEQGHLWQGMVECPWHHYRYDVMTGENVYPRNVYPANLASLQRDLRPLCRYAVQVIAEQIWVEV